MPALAPTIVTPHLRDTAPSVAYTRPDPGLPLTATGKPSQQRQHTNTQPHILSANDMRLRCEYNKKYVGYANYDPSAASLGESFYVRYLSLSAIGNDTRANDASPTTRPVHRALLRKPFGRTSPHHSFHQQACFETAYQGSSSPLTS